MPPALGWAAISNSVPAEAWLLVLISFYLDAAPFLGAGALSEQGL